MNAQLPIQAPPPFNREMFRWARERREITVEEAAARLGVAPASVAAWESGDAAPTIRQARKLAEVYDRAFLEFFRVGPPAISEPTLVPDFRLHRGEARPHESRDLKDMQVWAESTRANALDLFDILGEGPPTLPESLRRRPEENPARAAEGARRGLDFPISDQLDRNSRERDALPKRLREAMEKAGILVLKSGELGRFGARGLCIATEPLPVVVFGGEAPSAQLFTLAHELGHISLGESAVSGSLAAPPEELRARAVETWCNRFAAAFLIPEAALVAFRPVPANPAHTIDDADLNALARRFGVSPHAMLLRLIELGHVDEAHYWRDRRARFLAEEAAYRGGGRPSYYGSRYRSAVGDRYTGLVLDAWNTGRITNHSAAEFMGIKSLRHLNDIRDNFVAA